MTESENILRRISAIRPPAEMRQIATVEERRANLRKLRKELFARYDDIRAALAEDLGKPDFECAATEFLPLIDSLDYLIRKLPKLARGRRSSNSLMVFPASGRVVPEPYGLVLVVAAWNYPLILSLEPVIGSYAAGNHPVLKLPNKSPVTGKLVREILTSTLPDSALVVVDNEVSFSTLLREKFDYIFFTGNESGGREVLTNAAPNLTPCTLELGGKSPCVVARGANLKAAAERIAWGKFSNAGQTCVAPDYLLLDKEIRDVFIPLFRQTIERFYGTVPLSSPNLARLGSHEAYDRVSAMMERGKLICGGEKSPETLQIAPTVIGDLDTDSPLLNQEIFGPVLPVIEYESTAELFAHFATLRKKPLALYCFGGDKKLRSRLTAETSSGAVVFDDVIMHFVNPDMPFGGVGASGMGAYHGKLTFDTFSHYKPVLTRSNFEPIPVRFPPYTLWKQKLARILIAVKRMCRP